MEYLEENYGVQIDHDKYNVFYDGFASNIMPEITVILAEQEDAVNERKDTDKGIGHKRSFTMLLFLVFVLCALFLFLWEAGCMKIS